MGPRRTAIIDLGSNSFRLVVFTADEGWWQRTDEIFEAVRIGEGQEPGGPLGDEPMERALSTIDVFSHFCSAAGLLPQDVDAVATSAIRDASNREAFLIRVRDLSGLAVRVLSREQEARAGYLAAVNTATLADGGVTGNFRVLCDGDHDEELSEEAQEAEVVEAVGTQQVEAPRQA
jgi:exopolyphosphatase/guanosine-5'-triphosphate,3'-diphosphate pyrophosphatase